MKLQVLIPQYKETDEVIKPLLDSIALQQNIPFDEVGVIICNDGSSVFLSDELLAGYPYEIQYYKEPHRGVSGTRNACLDHATADYVMFCDADDMFFNACGERFRRIKWNNRGCRSTVWRCASRVNKRNSGIDCPARTVNEELLHEAIVDAINDMLKLSDNFYDRYRQTLIRTLGAGNTADLKQIEAELKEKQHKLIELSEKDPDYDKTVDEIYQLKDRKYEHLMDEAAREDTVRQADELMAFIKNQPSGITKFDDTLVRKLINKVKISDNDITVVFKTGYEVVVAK